MASIQRIVSPLTKDVSYRAQVRVKGRAAESNYVQLPTKGRGVGQGLESAIEDGRHFPHAAARRTSFDALAEDYIKTVLPEFDETQRSRAHSPHRVVGEAIRRPRLPS